MCMCDRLSEPAGGELAAKPSPCVCDISFETPCVCMCD